MLYGMRLCSHLTYLILPKRFCKVLCFLRFLRLCNIFIAGSAYVFAIIQAFCMKSGSDTCDGFTSPN